MRGRRRRKRSVSSTHRIKNYSPVSQQGLECDSHFSDAEERQQLHQHSARWAEVPPGVWAVMRLSPPSIPFFRDLMSQVWPLLLPGVLQSSGWWRRRAAADKICSDVFLTFVPLTSGIRLSCGAEHLCSASPTPPFPLLKIDTFYYCVCSRWGEGSRATAGVGVGRGGLGGVGSPSTFTRVSRIKFRSSGLPWQVLLPA